VAKALLTLNRHTGKSKEERAAAMTLLDLSSEPVASSGEPDEESMQKSGPIRGTQRIVSVNYLIGRPLIASDFLKRIVASNFRDMRNSMSVVFGLLKTSVWVPKKVSYHFRKGDKT